MRFNRDGFSVEAAIRKGRPLPEWYDDEPLIDPVDIFYLKSFYDLSTCRSSGMSIGQIPWTAMITYATHYGLAWDVTEAFIDIMREMDEAYIDDQTKEQKRLSDMKMQSK